MSEELIDKARRLLRPVDPNKRDPTLEETLARIERETGIQYTPVHREKEES